VFVSRSTCHTTCRNTLTLYAHIHTHVAHTHTHMSLQGMAFIASWGNLRYVANQAFMGLLHNKAYPQGRRAQARCLLC
jgi:hypothetical protein